MDLCRNITVSGGLASQYQPELLFSSCSKLGTDSLDDLFSSHTTTETDVGLEWLSTYVEDCFSSSGSCLLPAAPTTEIQKTTTLVTPKPELQQINTGTSSLHDIVIPGKARSKRKRSPLIPKPKNKVTTSWCPNDPPLLHQAYWLADSELILPKKGETHNIGEADQGEKGGKKKTIKMETQGRKCSHCLAQRTPQWRAGPMGPKTLCNACGVRYKSGRLLPEYRPAKSPTFVSYKHSNSHKKVLEMRMALQFSSLATPQL